MNIKTAEQKGGKEIGLNELKEHEKVVGYIVPDFLVLDDPDTGTGAELLSVADHFKGKKVIVRSNSVMENDEVGFDGIYKSVVVENCDFDSLKEACIEVADSLSSPEAIAYRKQMNIEDDYMRIIVQEFIEHNCQYMVIETSVNAQGDTYIAIGDEHDFINKDRNYNEVVIGKNGEILTITDKWFISRITRDLFRKLRKLAVNLQEVFGPISIEGAFGNGKIFLFQRRVLPKEIYQAEPEVVPENYTDKDILFRSTSYRGAGKIENLPVVVMPRIHDVTAWENNLRKQLSQIDSDVILFVSSMALGEISLRILDDYTVLDGVKAIISFEGIDYSSHAFKVASLARIPFVSVDRFSELKKLSRGSLYFTENEAVFCLNEIKDEYNFDVLKRSKETSLSEIIKKKGIIVKFSEDEKGLDFQINVKKISFDELYSAFHRLLEDTTDECWLFESMGQSIGFRCENRQGHVITFSGWANYMKDEGHVTLDNFGKSFFRENHIEWSLIQEIAEQVM